MTDQSTFRIKPGVRPYGGRRFPGYWQRLGNGRRVAVLYVATVAGNKARGLGGDPREYRENEVVEESKESPELI